MSIELIKEVHKILTEGTYDEKEDIEAMKKFLEYCQKTWSKKKRNSKKLVNFL